LIPQESFSAPFLCLLSRFSLIAPVKRAIFEKKPATTKPIPPQQLNRILSFDLDGDTEGTTEEGDISMVYATSLQRDNKYNKEIVDVCGRCCVIEEFPLYGGGSTYRINEI